VKGKNWVNPSWYGVEMLEFVVCKHCNETGTCKNGRDNSSCARCEAYWAQSLKTYKTREGEPVLCSVCWGKGVAEPLSSKWENRFTPILATAFVLLAFLAIFVFGSRDEFEKILVFASTLIGSVTGYYFGGERKSKSLPPTSQKVRPEPEERKKVPP
jgi:hypothetical protein